MQFERMKFKEIINESKNTVDYQINGKYVTKSVYESILNDDDLFILPPLPKVKNSPENDYYTSNNTTNSKTSNIIKSNTLDSYNQEQCDCPECQEILGIVSDIREMDDYEAKELIASYIEAVRIENQMETTIRIYNEIGNNLLKNSLKLEDQLNDYISQYENGSEDED